MVNSIRHRGPDGSGMLHFEGVALGHVRLSILDLSDMAAQPMRSIDKRYSIVFNGEIYNFRELRKSLDAKGIHFESTGDTRVLLEHMIAFGVDETLRLLEGMWAFAFWDEQEQTLVLSRDRHGIKPLYIADGEGGEILFGSEIRAVLGDNPRPCPAGVCAALLGLGGTFGQATLFDSVQSVEPGERLIFREGRLVSRERVLRVEDSIDPGEYESLRRSSVDAVMERVSSDFDTSMDYRLVSDAPVACMVSGGVDSSLIAGMAAGRYPNLQLYHADVKSNSERERAEEVARQLGRELHVTDVSPSDFLTHVADVTHFNENPLIYHLNSVPFYLVSRMAAKDGIKVVLTGEGSDEYFLGYPNMVLLPILNSIDNTKRLLQGLLHRVFPRGGRMLWPDLKNSYAEQLRQLVFRAQPSIVGENSARAYDFIEGAGPRSALERTLSLVNDHLGTLLHRNDRLGMAWGLESRFPFLGNALTRTALNLPSAYKVRKTLRFHDWRHPGIVDKWAVRKLAESYVSMDLAHRPKKGFPVSVDKQLGIRPSFFAGGFVEEWFGLDKRSTETLLRSSSSLWSTRLMLLDVWGRQFFQAQSRDEVREQLAEHVDIGA
jgi:asparagine synthase (glutamine-hydrolysing)